jgi:hypothetical protein
MGTIAARASGVMALVAVLSLAACGGPVATPSPTPAETPTPQSAATPTPTSSPPPPAATATPSPPGSPTPGVSSPAQAAAVVLASNPLFAGVGPLNPELIGQCCWYEALETGDGFEVTIELGWGDCPSGYIDRHRWLFEVGRDGSVHLLDERGSTVDETQLPQPGNGPARLVISLVAGPVCPVETDPLDPACAPRPVTGAEVLVRTPFGEEINRATSDDDGVVDVPLGGGAYIIEALSVDGLLGTPEAVAVSVHSGGEAYLFLLYDTGIR